MALGERIAEALDALDLSQAQLCDRVNAQRGGAKELQQQALSGLVKRDSKSSEFVVRIADALGVSIRWLQDGIGAMNDRDWPFPGIDPSRFLRLERDEQIEIQGLVRARIEKFDESRLGGAGTTQEGRGRAGRLTA